jgi:hypothetical protein
MSSFFRSAKLTIHGLAPSKIVNRTVLVKQEIPHWGVTLIYPEGWRTLATPMVLLEDAAGKLLKLRSSSSDVTTKTFVFQRLSDDTVDAELIYEVYASEVRRSIHLPGWEIGPCASVEEAYAEQNAFLSGEYGLVRWEERPDVPDWAKDVSLVAALHGQHWTGYIFHTYDEMLRDLRWLCERIEGKRILAYMPGWEGRYYWQYGHHRPDERVGGEAAFRRLCEGARELGVHLMPMYGINLASRTTTGFDEWGIPSLVTSTSGGWSNGGSVDWDGSRHHRHNINLELNPGAPRWQEHLADQIGDLCNEYGLDAVFLDIAACWYNDPHFPPTNEGVRTMCEKIRARRPDIFITGEGWYDALTASVPAFQSGHNDGPMNYHDGVYAPFFDEWTREFAHLCLGDPAHGSSGVHELGYNTHSWRTPLRKGIWPTVTLVGDSIEKAPERVEQILADAREYAERFCRR